MKIGERISGLPHFDVKVNEENLDSTMKMMLPFIKQSWDIGKLQRVEYNSGITNRLVGYYVAKSSILSSESTELDRSEIILMRIYGAKTELLIDRAKELRNLEELSRADIAPPVYCTFKNGYCYKFIEGKVCKPSDFTEEDVLQLSAHCLAELHTMKLSDKYLNVYAMESSVFDTIFRYLSLIPQTYSKEEKQLIFEQDAPSVEVLRKEVNIMLQAVSNLKNLAVTYCHNDLLLANCIISREEYKMRCIDHEYGGPNYSAYDIGNHFNEFVGVDEVDSRLFPKKETQLCWIRIYLNKVNELNGSNKSVTESDINELYINIAHMTLVSHLFWGIWSFIQAEHSHIDFDFMNYGIFRLNEYFSRKHDILSLSLSKN